MVPHHIDDGFDIAADAPELANRGPAAVWRPWARPPGLQGRRCPRQCIGDLAAKRAISRAGRSSEAADATQRSAFPQGEEFLGIFGKPHAARPWSRCGSFGSGRRDATSRQR